MSLGGALFANQRRFLSSVLLLWLYAFLAGGSASATDSGKTALYRKRVQMGLAFFRLDGRCYHADGELTSGDFFEGLEPVKSGHGIEFRKNSQVISSYPEMLLVTIAARRSRCPAVKGGSPFIALGGSLDSLRFSAQWREGGTLRAGEIHLMDTDHELWTETDPPVWTFILVVAGKSVPLSGQLVVSIETEAGAKLAQLAVDMANPIPWVSSALAFDLPTHTCIDSFVSYTLQDDKRIDRKTAETWQQSANNGQEIWRLDAKSVAAKEVMAREPDFPRDVEADQSAAQVPLEEVKKKQQEVIYRYRSQDGQRSYVVKVRRPDWLLAMAGGWDSTIWVVSKVTVSCEATRSPIGIATPPFAGQP